MPVRGGALHSDRLGCARPAEARPDLTGAVVVGCPRTHFPPFPLPPPLPSSSSASGRALSSRAFIARRSPGTAAPSAMAETKVYKLQSSDDKVVEVNESFIQRSVTLNNMLQGACKHAAGVCLSPRTQEAEGYRGGRERERERTKLDARARVTTETMTRVPHRRRPSAPGLLLHMSRGTVRRRRRGEAPRRRQRERNGKAAKGKQLSAADGFFPPKTQALPFFIAVWKDRRRARRLPWRCAGVAARAPSPCARRNAPQEKKLTKRRILTAFHFPCSPGVLCCPVAVVCSFYRWARSAVWLEKRRCGYLYLAQCTERRRKGRGADRRKKKKHEASPCAPCPPSSACPRASQKAGEDGTAARPLCPRRPQAQLPLRPALRRPRLYSSSGAF